jgi:hypothetical protein
MLSSISFCSLISIFLRGLSFLFSCLLVGCCYGRPQILLSGCLAELAVQWQLTMYFSAPQIIGNFKANHEHLLNKLWTIPQRHKSQTPLKTICMCSIRINEHPFHKQINVKHWNVEMWAVVAEWKACTSSSQSHCLLIQLKVYVKDLGIIFITTRYEWHTNKLKANKPLQLQHYTRTCNQNLAANCFSIVWDSAS